jgi:carbon-monoxide dehydrogenase medium subunit
MKCGRFQYHAPTDLAEALDLLGQLSNAKALAGGQSLVAMLNLRYAMPDDLVDLNRIGALSGVTQQQDGVVEIGAMTRQRYLERDASLAAVIPILRQALLQVGHIQTRNRGTIGGSLCHLDPAAELPAIAMLYDADIRVASAARGERTLSMAEFPAFYMTPAIEPDELVTAITIRPWPSGSRHNFLEFARRHGDFAIVAVGCLVSVGPSGAIDRAAIVLGGVGAAPIRLTAGEALLVGETPGDAAFRAAAATAASIDAMDDSTYSSAYRRHLAEVLVRRCLQGAFARGEGAIAA